MSLGRQTVFNCFAIAVVVLCWALCIFGQNNYEEDARFESNDCEFYVSSDLPHKNQIDRELRNWSDVDSSGSLARCWGDHRHCMAMWRYNDSETHWSNDTAILVFQGCWKGGDSCSSEHCIAHTKSKDRLNLELYFCCCDGDFCNSNFSYVPAPVVSRPSNPFAEEKLPFEADGWPVWLLIVLLCGCALAVIVAAVFRMTRGESGSSKDVFIESGKLLTGDSTANSDSGIIGASGIVCDLDLSTITLLEVIGRGRFGVVYRGCCLSGGDQVAVKVYQAEHYSYFANECQVYNLPLIRDRHENILHYYGEVDKYTDSEAEGVCNSKDEKAENATEMGRTLRREFWVVTKYMEEGTLQDYLKTQTVDFDSFCKLALGVARGLSFLHSDITRDGVHKPPVAHRDLNSRNVLIKDDGTCAICDLGFALPLNVDQHVDEAAIAEVGTVRYMAPEVLEGAVNLRDPSTALPQIDVYSLGLVLWEILSRCSDLFLLTGHSTPVYAPPYTREVATHPSLEQMQVYICKKKVRPVFPAAVYKFSQLPILRALRELVEDCWDQDSEARISSLCAHQRLTELSQMQPVLRALSGQQTNVLNGSGQGLAGQGSELSANDLADYYFKQENTAGNSSIISGHDGEPPNQTSSGYQSGQTAQDSPLPPQPYQGRNPCQERNLLHLVPQEHSSDASSCSSVSGEPRVTRSSFKKVDPCSAESLAKHLMSNRDPDRKAVNEPSEQLLALLLVRSRQTQNQPVPPTVNVEEVPEKNTELTPEL